MEIRFRVSGKPEPQARPRTFNQGGRFVTFSKKSAFRKQVYAEALKNRPRMSLDRALGLTLRFRMPRPKTGHKGELWHITRSDLSNLIKGVEDGINDTGIWRDDCLIAFLRAEKTYSDDFVGVEIGIIELENVPEAK